MGEAQRLPGNQCTVHRYHWPKPLRTVRHHVWPKEFGGPDSASNLVNVCDTGHYNIHAILTAYLKGAPLPKGTRMEKALARYGFEQITNALPNLTVEQRAALGRHIAGKDEYAT